MNSSANKKVLPDWRSVKLPYDQSHIKTMLMKEELKLLFSLGKDYFSCQGHIVDAGCFLNPVSLPGISGPQSVAAFP